MDVCVCDLFQQPNQPADPSLQIQLSGKISSSRLLTGALMCTSRTGREVKEIKEVVLESENLA